MSRRNKRNKGKCLRHRLRIEERSVKFLLFPSFDFRLPLSRLGITHVRHGSALAAPSALRDIKKTNKMRKIDLIIIHCTASRPDQHLTLGMLDQMHQARGWKCWRASTRPVHPSPSAPSGPRSSNSATNTFIYTRTRESVQGSAFHLFEALIFI